ncbi:MAG TPA: cell division protein FtsH, partial [Nitrospirae bacterium]|nr:cell division protein FtsH [Nitrospirota bacterium]HEW81657.1 cell division protein FtsH [Nitrospirota bacterium]
TDMARKMVCEWGMSEKLGPVAFGKHEEQIFLGKDFAKQKDYSEKTAQDIDAEIRSIVGERYEYAQKLLTDNKNILENIAQALLERETLGASDIEALIRGEELPEPPVPPVPPKQEKDDKPDGPEAVDVKEDLPDATSGLPA